MQSPGSHSQNPLALAEQASLRAAGCAEEPVVAAIETLMVTAPSDLAGAQTMHRKLRKLLAVALVCDCPLLAVAAPCAMRWPGQRRWEPAQ